MTVIYYNSNSGIQSANIDPYSGNLQLGEDFIWSFNIENGFIFKKPSILLAITNFRIFMFNFKTNKVTGLLLMSDLDDIVVMNTHTDYNSTRVGNYGRIVKGFWVSYGQTHGKRTPIGDIVFMSKGKSVITWQGLEDPNGLKKLVEALQKELYPKNFMSKYTPTTTPNTTPSASPTTTFTPPGTSSVNKSVCHKCGTGNLIGSSFCSKCGQVMR
jgi:hypothetical protein